MASTPKSKTESRRLAIQRVTKRETAKCDFCGATSEMSARDGHAWLIVLSDTSLLLQCPSCQAKRE